ncbi:MAG: DUF3105 domain-containing protein [Parcubacteria group bacterium]|nr:DUF3105 domain-containing protein [Parcubacteria group bacterium]
MNNLSPKELYEQKKNEKLAGEKRTGKFRMFKKILIWLAAVLVIGGGIYWIAKGSKEKIAERKIYAIEISDQGRNHIAVGASHPVYNSNPPTSGWHYEEWESKGVYKEQQPDEGLVHNLEHGYVWISYRPDASPEMVKQLESFYGFGKKIIVEPRKENDKLIAIAAWNWLDKFDPVSGNSLNSEELKRIGDFIDKYINQGPEPNAP